MDTPQTELRHCSRDSAVVQALVLPSVSFPGALPLLEVAYGESMGECLEQDQYRGLPRRTLSHEARHTAPCGGGSACAVCRRLNKWVPRRWLVCTVQLRPLTRWRRFEWKSCPTLRMCRPSLDYGKSCWCSRRSMCSLSATVARPSTSDLILTVILTVGGSHSQESLQACWEAGIVAEQQAH